MKFCHLCWLGGGGRGGDDWGQVGKDNFCLKICGPQSLWCDQVRFIWKLIAILSFSRSLLNNSKHLSSLASVINSKLWHCTSSNSNNLNCVLRFCYPELCLFLTLLYYNKLLPFRTKYSNSSWTCSAGPTNQSHFDSSSLCGIQSNASGWNVECYLLICWPIT